MQMYTLLLYSIGANMNFFSLCLWISFSCQTNDPTPKNNSQEKTLAKELPSETPAKKSGTNKTPEDQVKKIIDGIIGSNKLDIMITKLETNKETKKIRLEGNAKDNATVSILLKGLESESALQKVYLEKSDDGTGNNSGRKVFGLTAALSSK